MKKIIETIIETILNEISRYPIAIIFLLLSIFWFLSSENKIVAFTFLVFAIGIIVGQEMGK